MHVLEMTAGKNFTRLIRVVDAKNIWPELTQFEIRAQLRTESFSEAELIANLHEFMTPAYDDNDITISWTMTGEQTRELFSRKWGLFKEGFFNLILSDTGEEDSRSVVVPTIKLKGKDTTTTASGDT